MVKHWSKGRACQMERLPRTVDGSLWYCSSSPLLQTPDHVGIVNICSGRTSYFDAIAELASPAHTGRRTGTPLQFKAIGLQEPPGYKGYLATYDVPLYVVTLFTGIKASLVYAETDIKYLVPSAQHSGFRPRERSQVGWPLHRFFLEVDGFAVDHESAIPLVMDHPAFLALQVSPGLDYFQDEEVVLVDQAVV